MAIKRMTFTCDGCFVEPEEDEFVTEEEALEAGWFILRGPERELGGNGERTYCSKECLGADL